MYTHYQGLGPRSTWNKFMCWLSVLGFITMLASIALADTTASTARRCMCAGLH